MLLGWIPIIGPIVDGLVSIVRGRQNVEVEKAKLSVEELRVRLTYLEAVKDQIDIRIARDLIIFPVAVWCAIGTWDTIMAISYRNLMFHIEKFPPGPLEYLPFAVLAYLLGIQMKKMF